MTPTIRVAGVADGDALARLGAETFRDTFGHLYPPEDLATFLAEYHSVTAWLKLLGDISMRTWIAETSGQPVGYALAGPCKLPHSEVTENAGELKRLYIVRSQQGSGLGRLLFEEALKWLQTQGREPLWIGVYSENRRALRFYESRGFTRVGEYQFAVGRSRDREFILRRTASGERIA